MDDEKETEKEIKDLSKENQLIIRGIIKMLKLLEKEDRENGKENK